RRISSNGLRRPARRMNSALTSSSERSREPAGFAGDACTFIVTPWISGDALDCYIVANGGDASTHASMLAREGAMRLPRRRFLELASGLVTLPLATRLASADA